MSEAEKLCARCRDPKPLSRFAKYQVKKQSGLRNVCMDCHNAEKKEWARKNPEKTTETRRAYKDRNRDQIRLDQAEYREKNRQRINSVNTVYREQHREWKNAHGRKKYAENAEAERARRARYYRENKAIAAAQSHRRRALENNAEGTYVAEEFMQLCDEFNNMCLACGVEENLTADHVAPLSRGGSNSIENIQPLCRSCNSKKGVRDWDYRYDVLLGEMV